MLCKTCQTQEKYNLIRLRCFCLIYLGCGKSNNTVNPNTALAATLAKKCVSPFVGLSDSGKICLPTAFTPNGDGINDLHHIMKFSLSIYSSFQLTIYRTTGDKVIQLSNANSSWDGVDSARYVCKDSRYYVTIKYTTAGGISVDTGTYVYLLQSNASKTCVNAIEADKPYYKFPDQWDPITVTFPYITNEIFCN